VIGDKKKENGERFENTFSLGFFNFR